MLVDAVSAAVVFSLLSLSLVQAEEFAALVISYDFLAFAAQPILGSLIDRLRLPVISASFGAFLVILSLPIGVVFHIPILAILIVGIGNAIFHLGGGTIALNLIPRKATMPGLFVAPGAIGLLAGTLVGKTAPSLAWLFAFLLLILAIAMLFVKAPEINYEKPTKQQKISSFGLVLSCLLIAIAVRSLMGFAISFSWKSDISLLVALTMGVFLGKALGGVLADRFGWANVAVGSLIISAPLISFFGAYPPIAIFGMFLFNFTMPVTLVAMSNLFTGRPAFSFGMTCLALFLGAIFVFGGLGYIFANQLVSLFTILFSAVILFIGLKMGKKIFY